MVWFPALQSVDSIEIAYLQDVPAPISFAGAFPALTSVVHDLNILAVADLPVAGMCPVLHDVGGMHLDGPVTGPLPTFPSLVEIGPSPAQLHVFFTLPVIQTWNGAFPALTSVGEILIGTSGGPTPSNISSLASFMPILPSAGSVTLGFCGTADFPSIDLVNMVGAFSSCTHFSGLLVRGTGLSDLDFLVSLTTVDNGGITITDNPDLISIDGLDGVDGAACLVLDVENNGVLPTVAQVDALHSVLVSSGFVGVYTNTGNGAG